MHLHLMKNYLQYHFFLDKINLVTPEGKNYFLIIKLHGTTKQYYKDLYVELAKNDERVILSTDLDIVPLLVLADVIISAVSSAMIEFSALNKPIILFNNPNRFSYKNFNKDDIEYVFRDMGIEVDNLSEAKPAVRDCFLFPNEKSEKRMKYTDELLENKGKADACERIIRETFELFN